MEAPPCRTAFYDDASVTRELGAYGLAERSEIDEPGPHGGAPLPFINALCIKPA